RDSGNYDFSDCPPLGTLWPPGAYCSIFYTRTVQPGDPDPVENTACVESHVAIPVGPALGHAESGALNDVCEMCDVNDCDDHSVNLFQPCIDLDKTGPEFASEGDDIVYTVDICNCGSEDSPPLCIHEISDTLQGDLWWDPGNYDTNECALLGNGLAPGDCCAVTYTYTVPEGAPLTLENTATVMSHPLPEFPNEITDSDTHAVEIWCQAIDVVFAVDTSGSIQDEGAALCEGMQMIVDELAAKGIPVFAELLGMVENPKGSSFECLTGSVLATYGGDVPGAPPGCCPVLDKNEDWAAATAIIAERHTWMPDALRVIIPISDEGPEGGDPCENPGPDQEGVANAANIANINGVFVAPIMGDGTEPCVLALAAELAELTGGQSVDSTDPRDLADAIADILADLCRRRAEPPGLLVDLCPDDPLKLTPGICGCGVPDSDDDGDGVIGCLDNCPVDFNENQLDSDGDGVGDACEGEPQPLPPACGCGAGSGVTFALGLLSLFGLKLSRRRRR
ncbi:MAG: hypothetical protein JSU68_04710, partial [Phycisphaerales bacterium]